MPAADASVVKIHQNARSLSISTNAPTEAEFIAAMAAKMTTHDGGDESTEMFYREILPLIVNICCKIRGYKSDVTEHRILTAGEWLPEDIVAAIPTLVGVGDGS